MKKIAFALLSNSRDPVPSTRVACLNLFPYLRRAGFEPEILFEPAMASETPDVTGLVEKVFQRGCGTVVFQKIHGPSVMTAVTRLRRAGVRTIYCVCDLVDNEMAAAVDATIVVTDFLKSLYLPDLQNRIYVVHDGIERPERVKIYEPLPTYPRTPLRATLVTSHELYAIPVLGVPPRGWHIDMIGRYATSAHTDKVLAARRAIGTFEGLPAKLANIRALLHPRIRRISWHPEGVYEGLERSDVGIIPIDTSEWDPESSTLPLWKVKSENRLTLMMAVGLPVIATPIPSYERVIEQGVNGFLARSRKDWLQYLSCLRDPALRKEMGAKARASVVERYSLDYQAELFVSVLRHLKCDTSATFPVPV